MTGVSTLAAPATGTARLTAGLLAITVFSAFEQMAVGPVMPIVSTALGGVEQYGLAFASALATGVVGMVAAGIVIDRGRLAAAFLVSGILFSIGLLVMAIAPHMDVFIAGRLVQGLGSGGLAVCGFATVGAAYPVERHRPVLGLVASGWLLPSMFGPGLAVLVTEIADWRWLFLGVAVTAPLALVLVVPPLWRVRSEVAPSTRRAALIRLLLSMLVGAGVLVVSAAPGIAPQLTVVAVIVGIAVVVTGLWPVLPRGFFVFRRGLPAAIAARALGAAAIYSVQAYLPLMLAQSSPDGVLLGGLVLTAAAVGWAVAAVLSSQLQRRFSASAAVRAGSIVLAAGIALTTVAIGVGWGVAALASIWAVVGLAMGVLSPATTALVLRFPDGRGSNTAAMTISESSFSAAGIALGGVLVASLPGQLGFVMVASSGLVFAVAGVVAALRATTGGEV
ncbi:MFS transporter [Cnuibacter physcomitrellae]|uniref:MFS transporter n=1 Tax=Cnuibacter physcomitrellae TaxID=1619308 RepID=UPI002175ED04|nr:MFS transporter [Cnuibacter physcomitrellae]MCS5498292.1 MFS transporter [Cnuibacter physcomitrellae]